MQRGLAENDTYLSNPRAIHSYDRFIWQDWCENSVQGTDLSNKLRDGDSYIGLFQKMVEHASVKVEAHAVNLEQTIWLPDRIEFILNDAAKTWEVALSIMSQTTPRMLDGAYIAHQDYQWSTEAFLVPLMYLLREHFTPLYVVPGSCIAVFKLHKTIHDLSESEIPEHLSLLTPMQISDSFDWMRESTLGHDPLLSSLGEATTLWKAGHKAQGKAVVQKHRLSEITTSRRLNFQRNALKNRGLTALFED